MSDDTPMTKDEFLKSNQPLVFITSINPATGKHTFEIVAYEDEDWMMDVLRRDAPERFHFCQRNDAAAAAFARDLIGTFDVHQAPLDGGAA